MENNTQSENDILKSKGKSKTYSSNMTKNQPESFNNNYSKDEEYRAEKTKSVARDYTVTSGQIDQEENEDEEKKDETIENSDNKYQLFVCFIGSR